MASGDGKLDSQPPEIQAELAAATLKLRHPKKSRMEEDAIHFRKASNAWLRADCRAKNIAVRALSIADARAWATAVQVNGMLATDEWPLRMATCYVDADDDGNKLPLLSTIELVHLLEQAGELSSAQRVDLMRSWRMSGEMLHRDADEEYRRLFNEEPPNAQADNSHKA
ncbi:hypothetical protein D9M72_471680 [compost metagenome]